MSANSSNSFYELQLLCNSIPESVASTVTFAIANTVLLFPLCIYIIHFGLQQWRQQRSSAMTSHSDVFAYHMVVIELINVVVSVLFCCGFRIHVPEVSTLTMCLLSICINGQQFLHILTCVERYLAVVHPVTYLSLRGEKGTRIRNISIGCVWLLSFSSLYFMSIKNFKTTASISYCFTAFFITIILFCSLSVLCVLIRSGPGEGGRKQVDQSKLRAFYTITVILGVLLFRFVGDVVCTAVAEHLSLVGFCIAWSFQMWLSLPSSLVIPLLFLHRAGKLPGCRSNTELGPD